MIYGIAIGIFLGFFGISFEFLGIFGILDLFGGFLGFPWDFWDP